MLLIVRSSDGLLTLSLTLAWLFVCPGGVGSIVVVVTPTLFVIDVPRVTFVGFTMIVTVFCAALLMLPRLHVTNWFAPVVSAPAAGVVPQLPAEGAAETK